MFVDTLQAFMERNETIHTHASQVQVTAEGIWDLDLRLEWEGVGRIEVRNASRADAAALKEFLLGGLSERSRFLFAPYPYQGDLEGAIQKALAESLERSTLFIHGWHEGRIIGHFFLGGINEPVPGLGIAVADRCHGHKLGHLFMTLLIAAAHHCGKQAIELTTHLENQTGFHLYQKMGFEHVGDREITVADGTSRVEHALVYHINRKEGEPQV